MKKLILPIFLLAFLFSLSSVTAIANFCGDGICTNTWEGLNESNPLDIYYCPRDCGIITSSTWCEDTYSLISERDCPTTTCPTYGGCPECTISRISDSSLSSYCASKGQPLAITGSGGSGDINKFNIYWIVFLIIGFIAGYYYRKNKRRR